MKNGILEILYTCFISASDISFLNFITILKFFTFLIFNICPFVVFCLLMLFLVFSFHNFLLMKSLRLNEKVDYWFEKRWKWLLVSENGFYLWVGERMILFDIGKGLLLKLQRFLIWKRLLLFWKIEIDCYDKGFD